MARWVSTEWDKSKDSEERGKKRKEIIYKETRSKKVNIKMIQQLSINQTKQKKIGA